MRQDIALLLGAGFSAWSANLPTVSGLFDFSINPFGKKERDKLDSVKDAWHKYTSMHNEPNPEEFIESVLDLDTKIKECTIWYITRRLTEAFIVNERAHNRRHTLKIGENNDLTREAIRPAREFIKGLAPNISGIVTTNYDLLIEYALTTKGFNYGQPGEVLMGRGPYPVSQYLYPVKVTGSLRLSKIHGSVSWDEFNKYSDSRRGVTGKALIIAPIKGKGSKLQLNQQQVFAKQILLNSKGLIVFGCALNEYDKAFIELLESTSEVIERLLIIDPNPNLKKAGAIWRRASIRTIAPPKLESKEIVELSKSITNFFDHQNQ